jgi:hypothetical protein
MNEAQFKTMIAQSKVANLNKHLLDQKKKKKRKGIPQPVINSPQKEWLTWNVAMWCNEKALTLRTEYFFHPERKWRFDFEIESLMVGIEYNGIMSNKSRHTTIAGYSGDMEKINAAQQLGYTVFQYTPLNYKNVLQDLDKYLIKYLNNSNSNHLKNAKKK